MSLGDSCAANIFVVYGVHLDDLAHLRREKPQVMDHASAGLHDKSESAGVDVRPRGVHKEGQVSDCRAESALHLNEQRHFDHCACFERRWLAAACAAGKNRLH